MYICQDNECDYRVRFGPGRVRYTNNDYKFNLLKTTEVPELVVAVGGVLWRRAGCV